MLEFKRRSATPQPMAFDKVIRCLGWKHDRKIYAADAAPVMQPSGKYPVMTAEYESITVAGLYFAGTLSHGNDHLRAAGGFIHGFRYTARNLFRVLESKLFGGVWPGQSTFPHVDDWDQRELGTLHMTKLADRATLSIGQYL